MIQYSNVEGVMDARDHLINGVSSKSLTSRENFFIKHKGLFIIGLTVLGSLAFWLTIAYFDEGYNRFPTEIVDYVFVVLYALFFPIIPVISVYLIRRKKD